MKPNFALSLSFDGIGLLHRTAGAQWHIVGEVALKSADLRAQVAELREKAAALEPSGVTTKLVIPDSQIRYLDLSAADTPDADHEAAAMHALDGATPYALDDLAFDWNVVDGRLQVAAVARETLQEAESFAREHRFNPVSFVARPETAAFGIEPFFGETAQDGRRVERDRDPIEIAGAGRIPKDDGPVSSTQDPAAQEPVVRAPGPDDAGTDRSAQHTASGPETDSPGLASIRAARAVPETGAPSLAGAARTGPVTPSEGVLAPDGPSSGSDGSVKMSSPAPAAASLAPLRDAVAAARPSSPRRRGGKTAATGSAPVARRRDPAGPARARGVTAAESGPTAKDEADRLTIFGARETQRRRRGKPRFLGLILTSVLLLALAGVAAWATIFPDSRVARLVRGAEPQVAVTPESPDTAPDTALTDAAPAGSPAPDTSQPETALAPPPDPQPEALSSPVPDAAPETSTSVVPATPSQTGPLTREEARSRSAETGIWQIPPDPPTQPDAGSLEDFYLTSIDEDLPVGDAVALPEVPQTRSDTRPRTPPSPAPPGTRFELDARGLVVARREGALTPDGIEVRAGPPPVVPPDTPPRAVPVPGLTLSPEAAAELDRISGIRPRTRPDDLLEQHERGALGGRSRTEMADLRPRPRPATMRQPAAATDTAAVDAAPAKAAESSGPDVAAMAQAVTASLKPHTRPDELVRRARRVAPRSQAAAPRFPSSASVARTATARNAVNLRQVNLIGIYGSPSNRRALVRLSNGRYRKVQVGDRLDGGRVAAIGDGELRYTRRGRAVVLRMPKG